MTALEGLEVSRARLRREMSRPAVAASANGPPKSSWLDVIKDLPLIGRVTSLLRQWRPVGQLVVEAARAGAMPLAERNPFALVLVAGAAGAVLLWSRPWRWIFSSAVLAALLPRLVALAASRVPLESWIKMIGASLFGRPVVSGANRRARSADARDGV
jgi:hypothetical protein